MTETETVKVRQDLIISEQSEADEVFAIVKDPETQKFFRMKGLAYLILQELNQSSLSEIQHALYEKHHLTVSLADLETFVQGLRGKNLLDEPADGTREVLEEKSLNYLVHLRIKIPLVSPDNFLGRLASLLDFIFTPTFLFLSMVLIIAGVVITALHWSEIIGQIGASRGAVGFILLTLGMQILVISIHELSHGIVCKKFGGNVNEAGIMLLAYVLPCLYCNLNDIRLFDSRRKRMAVLLAGIYSGLLLAGIGAIMWLVVPEGTIWRLVSAGLIVNAGLLSLINLNPLVSFDGYYVLSELTNIPNLRFKSFGFFIGGVLLRRPVRMKAAPKKEKVIYVIYASLALTQNVVLMVFGVWGIVTLLTKYL